MSSRAIALSIAAAAAVSAIIIVGRRPAATKIEAADKTHTSVVAAASLPNVADSLLLQGLTLTVYKTPTCGCCKKWVEHMQAAGFKVVTEDHNDMDPIKKRLGVKPELQSCHTATIGNYVIEGHVPAEDVLKLLREKAEVAGLTAPGMPAGSPGMEMGPVKDKYDVLTFDKTGATKVFSHR